MGKFRLSTHRKNEERKKWGKRASKEKGPPTTLPVSLPLSTVKDLAASSAGCLRERVTALGALPAGWVDVTEHTDATKEIVFCKFSSKQSLVRVSYSVHITEDFQWRLICRGRSVPHPEACPLLRSVPSALKSVTDVVQILTLLNTSTVCEGNADERFHCLSNSRKGRFMDPTCTYVYMHV